VDKVAHGESELSGDGVVGGFIDVVGEGEGGVYG
jgi:hypothetical protein